MGGAAGGTHIPCADMHCDSGCGLTIIRIHERQRSLPLPIHPSLRERQKSVVGKERPKEIDKIRQGWVKKRKARVKCENPKEKVRRRERKEEKVKNVK